MSARETAVTPELVSEAERFLRGRIRRTPVELSPGLSERLGVPIWLKLEHLQETGSFKLRGAFFALSCLSEKERRRGVLTCSAGNHGLALAYAASRLSARAVVCVPRAADDSKVAGIRTHGAEVRVSDFPGYDATEEWAIERARREGLPFLSAFDDPRVISANGGTIGLEVLEEVPDARAFVLPVGGGGLAAGFAFVAKKKSPEALVIGCQHEGSPGLARSLAEGRAVTRLPAIETAAGGVEGGLGELPFAILRSRIARVALVSEEEIFAGVRWMLAEHRYLVEPSAAVAVAACLSGKCGPLTAPAAIVLSGRNVATPTLARILCGPG
jgi:threonine dehydratase